MSRSSVLLAGAAALVVAMGSNAAEAAAITVLTAGCGATQVEQFSIVGDWSRTTSGVDLGLCTAGSGTASGGIRGVRSTSEAASSATAPSTPVQTINGTQSFSTYEFMVQAPAGMTEQVLITISALFQGTYDISARSSVVGGAATAVAITGANMFVASIGGQIGLDPSFVVRSSRQDTEASDAGILSEILQTSVFVDVNVPFDVRLVSEAFASAGASLQSTGTSAAAVSQATASLTFDRVSLVDRNGTPLGDDFCVDAPGTSLDTCSLDPAPPVPSVPLPAAGWLLLAGLCGLGLAGRRARV